MTIIRQIISVIGKAAYVVAMSLELFFLLPLAACSRKVFDRAWQRYFMRPLPQTVFNLCVQWLLHVGARIGLSYERINVVIFCIVWPIITIASIVLNIILLSK